MTLTDDANFGLQCRQLLPQLLPSLSHMLCTLTLATNWSRLKAIQFLNSWSLGPFFLITQTDLKVLLLESLMRMECV